jgi:hypothetical protein
MTYALVTRLMEATMARVRLFDVHRTWEDYLGMLLGVVIVMTPLFTGHGDDTMITMNAGIVGIAVFSLAAFELMDLRRWEESLELLFGLWLMASPFVFGYAGGGEMLMIWHLAIGGIVVLLATLELWQDWTKSDRDLAAHGH